MGTTRHLLSESFRSVRPVGRRVRRWWISIATLGLLCGALIGPLSAPTLGAGHAVRIVDTGGFDFAFAPRSISVPVGTRISWTNASVTQHNVTFASFGSTTYMEPGTRYTHTFGTPGTFHYTCTLHGFSGTVLVTGSAPQPKPTPKPTPKPASGPTSTPIATDGGSSETPAGSPSVSAVGSTGGIALDEATSPTPGGTLAGSAPASDADVGSNPSTPLILIGLLVVAVIGSGAVILRRR